MYSKSYNDLRGIGNDIQRRPMTTTLERPKSNYITSTLPPRVESLGSTQDLVGSYRLQIHLPYSQLRVVRINPYTEISVIIEDVCTELGLNSNNYIISEHVDDKTPLDIHRTFKDYKNISHIYLHRKMEDIKSKPYATSRTTLSRNISSASSVSTQSLFKKESKLANLKRSVKSLLDIKKPVNRKGSKENLHTQNENLNQQNCVANHLCQSMNNIREIQQTKHVKEELPAHVPSFQKRKAPPPPPSSKNPPVKQKRAAPKPPQMNEITSTLKDLETSNEELREPELDILEKTKSQELNKLQLDRIQESKQINEETILTEGASETEEVEKNISGQKEVTQEKEIQVQSDVSSNIQQVDDNSLAQIEKTAKPETRVTAPECFNHEEVKSIDVVDEVMSKADNILKNEKAIELENCPPSLANKLRVLEESKMGLTIERIDNDAIQKSGSNPIKVSEQFQHVAATVKDQVHSGVTANLHIETDTATVKRNVENIKITENKNEFNNESNTSNAYKADSKLVRNKALMEAKVYSSYSISDAKEETIYTVNEEPNKNQTIMESSKKMPKASTLPKVVPRLSLCPNELLKQRSCLTPVCQTNNFNFVLPTAPQQTVKAEELVVGKKRLNHIEINYKTTLPFVSLQDIKKDASVLSSPEKIDKTKLAEQETKLTVQETKRSIPETKVFKKLENSTEVMNDKPISGEITSTVSQIIDYSVNSIIVSNTKSDPILDGSNSKRVDQSETIELRANSDLKNESQIRKSEGSLPKFQLNHARNSDNFTPKFQLTSWKDDVRQSVVVKIADDSTHGSTMPIEEEIKSFQSRVSRPVQRTTLVHHVKNEEKPSTFIDNHKPNIIDFIKKPKPSQVVNKNNQMNNSIRPTSWELVKHLEDKRKLMTEIEQLSNDEGYEDKSPEESESESGINTTLPVAKVNLNPSLISFYHYAKPKPRNKVKTPDMGSPTASPPIMLS